MFDIPGWAVALILTVLAFGILFGCATAMKNMKVATPKKKSDKGKDKK